MKTTLASAMALEVQMNDAKVKFVRLVALNQPSLIIPTDQLLGESENKKITCGTTSVPIKSLHKAPETPPRGLRGQASKRASSTRQSDASQGACVQRYMRGLVI